MKAELRRMAGVAQCLQFIYS